MGTIVASTLIAQLAELYEDVNFVACTSAQWLGWLNDAQRAVVLVRPDAKAVIETFKIASNQALQELPADVMRLGGVTQNMGADGQSFGRAITGPVSKEQLDAVAPDWMTTAGSYVRQFAYDEAFPRYFFVVPPVAGSWYIALKAIKAPTDIATTDGTIDLDDVYSPAYIEWALYRVFARDSERTPNWTRAGRHFQNFFQLLGVKTRADMAVSPKILEYDRQLAAK